MMKRKIATVNETIRKLNQKGFQVDEENKRFRIVTRHGEIINMNLNKKELNQYAKSLKSQDNKNIKRLNY